MNLKKYSFRIYLIIIPFLLFLNSCSDNSIGYKSVKFIVVLNKPLINQQVYLTGSNEILGNWNPAGVVLDKQSDTIWSKTFSFRSNESIEFKFTKGSFKSEATNEDGWIYENSRLDVRNDTTITIHIPNWVDSSYSRRVRKYYFEGPDAGIKLINNWRYHSGDNKEWAEATYNDSSWETVSSDLTKDNLPLSGWKNIGWFRTHLTIDSSLMNQSLAYLVSQFGASEIYLNGKLIHKFGVIGTDQKDYIPTQNRDWFQFKFDPQKDQVLAVRYANYSMGYLNSINFTPGFTIDISNINTILYKIPEYVRSATVHEMIFTVIPLILFLIHILFFVFYPKQIQNLYYAICLLGFAGLTYFNYERYIVTDPGTIILCYIMNNVSVSIAIFFGSMTTLVISRDKLPKYWWTLLIPVIIMLVIGVVQPVGRLFGILSAIYFGLSIIGVIVLGFTYKQTTQKGTIVIFWGFIILSIFVAYQLLIDFSVISPLFNIQQVFVYGMLGLAVSMSIFLAYNFANVNKNLELQLNNVKLLSEKTLEQERIANKMELERRIVDVENNRKTKELEDARHLQLSLLPKDVPHLDNFDIACFMKTATEVGGDYYDFFRIDEHTFTTVMGDATGHGLKAGNMVIVTKGLLNILSGKENLDEILKSSNNGIKKMNMHMLTMCLAILRIKDNNLHYASAGMPPLLIYRNKTNTVEQIILKAMPLGAFYDFPYRSVETTVSKDDVIMMMSDGLTELFNTNNETYGIENIMETLKEVHNNCANDIINCLVEKSTVWADGKQLLDDMTVIVIKVLN